MVAPAPLEVIREKLSSPTDDVRIVALWHAQAHGTAARPLAPDVARRFEDDNAAVAWHAMRTFNIVGVGSAESVPVLLAQIEKGTPEMLVRRAISSLGTVGPAAIDAVPVLLPLDAMEHLVAIAPDDPRVRERIVTEVLKGKLTYLARVPECVDMILPKILARADGQLLPEISAYRPAAAIARALELLDSSDADVVYRALRVLKGTYTPRLVSLARSFPDSDVRRTALEALPLDEALPIARELIHQLADCLPLRGDGRHPGYELAAAAKIIARAHDVSMAPALVSWLTSLPDRIGDEEPNCYSLRDILTATCTLVDAVQGDRISLVVASWIQTFIDRDQSGVLDFHRELRKRAEHRDDAYWESLAAIGIPRRDPYAKESSESVAPELPDFPPEASPRPPPCLVAAPVPELHAVKSNRPRAASLVGMALTADPLEIVKAIDVHLKREQRLGHDIPRGDCVALSHLWGDATSRATGWRWRGLLYEGETYLAIASPDDRFAIEVSNFITQQLQKADRTIVLTFNMIVANRLPEPAPDRVSIIG